MMRRRTDHVAIAIVVPLLLAVFACAITMTIGIRLGRAPVRLSHHAALHVAYGKWNGPPNLRLTQNGRLIDAITPVSPGIHTFEVRDETGAITYASGVFYAGYVTPVASVQGSPPVAAQGCPTRKNTLIDDVF